VLLALCSLRRAEILNLTTRDFDFDNQYVNITPKTTTQQTWQWDIKNHQQAIVPMPETIELPTMAVNLHNFIYDLIAELPEGQPYVIVKPSYYRRLMNQSKISFEKRNCPWGNFNRDFTNLLRRASVDQKRFHELRATFATIMAKYHSLPKVQKLMRHSSPQTTVKYIRNDEQKLIASTVKVMKKCYATNVP
jgi:integrase